MHLADRRGCERNGIEALEQPRDRLIELGLDLRLDDRECDRRRLLLQ
jgi:hypothetical protein